MSFYVVLPSNSSNEYFKNTLTRFNTKLQVPLDLNDGKTMVGLSEFQYTDTWYNVINCIVFIFIRGEYHSVEIPDGRYSKIEDVLDELRKQLSSYPEAVNITFHYDIHSMKMLVNVRSDRIVVKMNIPLCNIFGFENKPYPCGVHVAPRQVDINSGMTALYVYSNVVKSRAVGNGSSQLLRVISIPTEREHVNRSITFQKPHYLPTEPLQSDVVTIDIRRDDGTLVPFNSGKVIVTLHFREK